jgi:hypothetical protein
VKIQYAGNAGESYYEGAQPQVQADGGKYDDFQGKVSGCHRLPISSALKGKRCVYMFENLNMSGKDLITILAVVAGPILAVQAQKYVEAFRERKQRRLTIFKTLMSTRAERLHREHVRSLNMIDIEFYGRRVFCIRFQMPREKAVTNAWKNYNDHLNNKTTYASEELWVKDADTLFTKLLYSMSINLGYDYDEVQLKRDCYRPEAHANIEKAQLDVLSGLADVLRGKRSFPMVVTDITTPQDSNVVEKPTGDSPTTETGGRASA